MSEIACPGPRYALNMTDPTIHADVLAILRCPKTGQALRQEQRDGQSVLVSQDGRHVYTIRGGIPVLLPETDPSNMATAGVAGGGAADARSNKEISR